MQGSIQRKETRKVMIPLCRTLRTSSGSTKHSKRERTQDECEKSGNRERRIEKSHHNCFVVMKENHIAEQDRGMRWQPRKKWRSAPFQLKWLLDGAVKIQLNHVCLYVSALINRKLGTALFYTCTVCRDYMFQRRPEGDPSHAYLF